MSKYVIYCDESDRKGKNYSYFYGALAFDVNNFAHLENYLKSNKVTISQISYNGELKWSKISNSKEDEYLYKTFIDAIFHCIESGRILVRIFCCDNVYMEGGHSDDMLSFHKLYYKSLVKNFENFNLTRIHFDRLPYQNKEKIKEFKGFIANKLQLNSNDLIEVDSSKHVFSQAIDIILGAISFRLNDKHKFKDNNKKQRGKKTIAKDRMYRYILSKIKNLTPEIHYQYFDPKKSTPTLTSDGVSRIVSDKYRHWIMISKSNLEKYFNDIEEKKRRYLTAYPKDLANRTSET